MVEFYSGVGNVFVHCETDCAIGVYWVVVPLQVDARVKIAFPVYSYVIVFFWDGFEVGGMSFPNLLNSKVIN